MRYRPQDVRGLVPLLFCACSFHPSGLASDAAGDGSGDSAVAGDGPTVDAPPPGSDAAAPQIVLAGLIEDLDGDLGVSGISPVTRWTNQVSGQGDDVTAAAGPGTIRLVPAAVNGHGVLVFDGAARLEGSNAAPFVPLVNGNGLTWFAVILPGPQDNPAKNQMFGTIKNDGNHFDGFTAGVNGATSTPYAMMRPNSADELAQATTPTVGSWVVLAGELDAGMGSQHGSIYVNDPAPAKTITLDVPGGAASGPLTVGSQEVGGTEFYTGSITRILIYDRPLLAGELQATGRALSQRYAITTAF